VSCLVSGRPKPVISWYFDGRKLESMMNFSRLIYSFSGSQFFPALSDKYIQLEDGLLVKNVTNDDRGDYVCKAYQISHSISNIEEEIIHVIVRGSPIPLSLEDSIFYGYLGGTTNLTCEFETQYPARISWFRTNSSIKTRALKSDALNLSHLPVKFGE
jgi:hypothetical protein